MIPKVTKKGMSLKQGIKALREDNSKLLRHKEWSEDCFIFLRPDDTVPAEFVQKIKTIPGRILEKIDGTLHFPITWAMVSNGENGWEIEPVIPSLYFKKFSRNWEVV